MIVESFPVEPISWELATTLSRKLADMIKDSGYRPDYVIAIGRGGFVPARIVCDSLLITNLTSIRLEHWGTAATRFDTARIRFPLSIDVEGSSLLVIDDVTDTGETLMMAMEYLSEKTSGEIRTGVLQHKSSSSFVPDYYAEKIMKWRWIIYPWALHEDLVGFAERLLTRDLTPPDDLYRELRQRYDMSPGMPAFKNALDELVEQGKARCIGGNFKKNESQ
jgi:hypoxanthine phosphoribosyltransferase